VLYFALWAVHYAVRYIDIMTFSFDLKKAYHRVI